MRNLEFVNIDCAYDGKMAFEMCKANEYNFVFMDVNMPIMNGYEAAVLIKRLYK